MHEYDKTQTIERCEETFHRQTSTADAFGDLLDPAVWAALIQSGVAHKCNRATDVDIRVASSENGGEVDGEVWLLRAPNVDGGRAVARKACAFTAVCGGPSIANKHPFDHVVALPSTTVYLADDITLSFNSGHCAAQPETAVDGEECSIEVDPKGAEYLLVTITDPDQGVVFIGQTNIG